MTLIECYKCSRTTGSSVSLHNKTTVNGMAAKSEPGMVFDLLMFQAQTLDFLIAPQMCKKLLSILYCARCLILRRRFKPDTVNSYYEDVSFENTCFEKG